MAKITISELRPAGAELFEGSESYLQELTDTELDATNGGIIGFVIGVGVGILISARYCNA
ncbi:MAG: hypothetical protein AAFW70_13890 [Cyanobacteria bacterium J06635_10]